MSSDLATRLDTVRDAIARAVARRGEGPPVHLLAVSKRHPMSAIQSVAALGVADFGENYAQELRDKRAQQPDAPWRWHYIGALQRNKVKLVVGCALVHSVDRPALLDALQTRAASKDHIQSVLVQVNVAGEAGKAGVAPGALPELLDRFADLSHVRCRGLMLIPPAGSPEQTRPHFTALRRLSEQHARIRRPHVDLTELSMGMSADFEVAIEEGATLVRVGTAIFGPRPSAPGA